MRLIDADALKNAIMEMKPISPSPGWLKGCFLTLLDEQPTIQPDAARVMTLEEVQQHYSLPPIFPDDFGMQEDYYNDIEPLYFEFQRDDPYIVHWRGYNQGVAVCLSEWKENYGKTWRCWTARPTKEQRLATPWGTAVNA